MTLSPQLRVALAMTAGAALFVIILLNRFVTAMMADPNFGRGDNPFEIVAILACALGPLTALGSAVALAFRFKHATTVPKIAAAIFLVGAGAVFANFAIAGSAETPPSQDLVTAQTAAGLGCVFAAIAIFLLLRWLRKAAQ